MQTKFPDSLEKNCFQRVCKQSFYKHFAPNFFQTAYKRTVSKQLANEVNIFQTNTFESFQTNSFQVNNVQIVCKKSSRTVWKRRASKQFGKDQFSNSLQTKLFLTVCKWRVFRHFPNEQFQNNLQTKIWWIFMGGPTIFLNGLVFRSSLVTSTSRNSLKKYSLTCEGLVLRWEATVVTWEGTEWRQVWSHVSPSLLGRWRCCRSRSICWSVSLREWVSEEPRRWWPTPCSHNRTTEESV